VPHSHQRLGPILDPDEFSSRYIKHYGGNETVLGPEGRLVASVLVIWAITFALDEAGLPARHLSMQDASTRKETCNKAISQALHYIDYHGILRRPTWDGVRALLLLFPLTEGWNTPLKRKRFAD
jgi:hypothetical protein